MVLVFYILSLVVLIAYTFTILNHTSIGSLGAITSVAVITTDLVLFILVYISLKLNPIMNVIILFVMRLCLIIFGL